MSVEKKDRKNTVKLSNVTQPFITSIPSWKAYSRTEEAYQNGVKAGRKRERLKTLEEVEEGLKDIKQHRDVRYYNCCCPEDMEDLLAKLKEEKK